MLCLETSSSRIAMVILHRYHTFQSMVTIQHELSDEMVAICPEDLQDYQVSISFPPSLPHSIQPSLIPHTSTPIHPITYIQVPFLTIGSISIPHLANPHPNPTHYPILLKPYTRVLAQLTPIHPSSPPTPFCKSPF